MFFSLKIKMAPKTVFGLFIRFCLLACAALFMVKVLEEFLNGNTGYATSKESLSQTDIPTVMFCHSRNDDSSWAEKLKPYMVLTFHSQGWRDIFTFAIKSPHFGMERNPSMFKGYQCFSHSISSIRRTRKRLYLPSRLRKIHMECFTTGGLMA